MLSPAGSLGYVRRMRSHRSTRLSASVVGALLLAVLPACAGVSLDRTTETSGTFSSYGFAFTILSSDFPKGAMLVARENASDANMANMEIKDSILFPYLGPFDFLLDIIGFRYARIRGTWGYAGT
jgi:hypothetical protein